MLIAPPRVVVRQEPIYLYVPPGHQKNWGKHCARYSACAQPVHGHGGKKEKHEKKHKGKHNDD